MHPGSPPPRTAIVIGAGFAGLLAAAAAAQAGCPVTVLDRDPLTPTADPRPGVPQGEQAHVLLHRGLLAVETLLPGLGQELLDRGGKPFNTGQMPWLGEHGWMPRNDLSYEIISIGRPLLELVVRGRVAALDGVTLRGGIRVARLSRTAAGWTVHDPHGPVATADLVIDASGRSSRLPHWLAELGIATPEPTIIEARLGYATRRYRGTLPLKTGAVVAATPQVPVGALVLPIEDDDWLVCAAGYGDRRPDRDPADFHNFLTNLRDPIIADRLEPVGSVALHRQTANRRHAYGSRRDWPAGLFVVGDAQCAFNPVYGQGITVAATQAALLPAALRRHDGSARSTRRIQRRLAAVADLPWSVATSEDLRMPTSDGEQSLVQRLLGRWTTRMIRLAAAGDEPCTRAFGRVYHLMGSPLLLVSPPVVRAVVRSLATGIPPAQQRPAILARVPPQPDRPDRLPGRPPLGEAPGQQRLPSAGSRPSTR